MKKVLTICILGILSLIVPLKAAAITKLISADRHEITLRVSMYDVKKKEFLKKATAEALQTVLFRGVPETNFRKPLVGNNEKELMKKNKKFFNELFEERGTAYVTSIIPHAMGVKDATGKKAYIADITINMTGLKEDLESHGIIRKFGL